MCLQESELHKHLEPRLVNICTPPTFDWLAGRTQPVSRMPAKQVIQELLLLVAAPLQRRRCGKTDQRAKATQSDRERQETSHGKAEAYFTFTGGERRFSLHCEETF